MKVLWIAAAPIALLALAACATLKPDKVKIAEAKPTLRLTLLPQGALIPGKPTTVIVKLNNIEQRAIVTDDQLDTVHTQKIHLLVIDSSFTDYQHIHPQKSGIPGVYSFSFTPRLSGGYRVWADVTPSATHKEEFDMADLGSHGAIAIAKTESREAVVGDYRFALSLDAPPVEGGEAMGMVRISDAGGKPVTSLQPIMGAFAHIVGFYGDYRTVAHIHPMGPEPAGDTARGGPELHFHFAPDKAGYVKLFVQVRINGKELFAPFGVMVEKAPK